MCCTSNCSRRPSRVHERALERVRVGAAAAAPATSCSSRDRSASVEQPVEARALDLVGAVAEHALDRRALVGDDSVGVENGDQVAGVRDERAETGLALSAGGDLRRATRLRPRARSARRARRASRATSTANLEGEQRPGGRGPRRGSRAGAIEKVCPPSSRRSLLALLRAASPVRIRRRAERVSQPVECRRRDKLHVSPSVEATTAAAVFLDEREPHRRLRRRARRAHAGDRGLVDLLAAGGADEVDTRAPQGPFARRRCAPLAGRARPSA